jgi:hypothetical protein
MGYYVTVTVRLQIHEWSARYIQQPIQVCLHATDAQQAKRCLSDSITIQHLCIQHIAHGLERKVALDGRLAAQTGLPSNA